MRSVDVPDVTAGTCTDALTPSLVNVPTALPFNLTAYVPEGRLWKVTVVNAAAEETLESVI